MRKSILNQIIEMLKSLEEANKEIINLIKFNKISETIELLKLCQDMAEAICNALNTFSAMSNIMIELFENYYRILYQISINLSNVNSQEIKNLKHLLYKIRTNIECSIVVEYEVLFLPYKISMWDSMESVWLSMKEDKRFNCVVMPIPYYSFSNNKGPVLNYEGESFPTGVPIVHYNQYDISASRPDAIIIHNPYDDNNYVTSVLPQYYSSELKKHTDLLIYIPYFVGFGSTEDINEAFIVSPGVLNADKVILQNHQIKNLYLSTYKKYIGVPHNDKFIALGSPKFDKVFKTIKAPVSIPAEWELILEGRKVVLYNSSLTTLLKYKEKAIEKIKFTLDTFKSNNNVTLLWRPHPLFEATLSSMLPSILHEYKQIVQSYCTAGWGIYDDSEDIYRAFALSDAYYGDAGSLLALYGITGRPMLLQNVDIIHSVEDDELYNVFHAYASSLEDNSKIYFCAPHFNSLLEYDCLSGLVNDFGSIPGQPDYIQTTTCTYFYRGKVFCLNRYTTQLSIYNIENKNYKTINLNYFSNKNNLPIFHFQCFNKDAKLYCFNSFFPYCFSLNLEIEEIEYLDCDILYSRLGGKINIVYDDEFECLAIGDYNTIAIINKENFSFQFYKIGTNQDSFYSACFDGIDYWFLCKNTPMVLRWNPVNKSISHYNYSQYFININDFTGFLRFYKDKIFIFNSHVHNTIIIDIKSNSMKNIEFPKLWEGMKRERTYYKNGKQFFICCKKSSNCYFDFPIKQYSFDFNTLKVSEFSLKLSKKTENIRERNLRNGYYEVFYKEPKSPMEAVFWEESSLSLERFLTYIQAEHLYKERQIELFNKLTIPESGEKINEMIRDVFNKK